MRDEKCLMTVVSQTHQRVESRDIIEKIYFYGHKSIPGPLAKRPAIKCKTSRLSPHLTREFTSSLTNLSIYISGNSSELENWK